nr:hypothetical protein [Leptospira sp. severe_002]
MKKSEDQLPLTDKQLKESEELKKLRKENLKLKEEDFLQLNKRLTTLVWFRELTFQETRFVTEES